MSICICIGQSLPYLLLLLLFVSDALVHQRLFIVINFLPFGISLTHTLNNDGMMWVVPNQKLRLVLVCVDILTVYICASVRIEEYYHAPALSPTPAVSGITVLPATDPFIIFSFTAYFSFGCWSQFHLLFGTQPLGQRKKCWNSFQNQLISFRCSSVIPDIQNLIARFALSACIQLVSFEA